MGLRQLAIVGALCFVQGAAYSVTPRCTACGAPGRRLQQRRTRVVLSSAAANDEGAEWSFSVLYGEPWSLKVRDEDGVGGLGGGR